MKVIVKARHMNLTPHLKTYAEEKLGKAIARVFDKPAAKIEIELVDLGHAKDNSDKECRVTVFIPKGNPVVIVEVDDNMYKAIDLCHDRLLQSVKRERERRLDNARGRKAAADHRAETAREVLSVTREEEQWEKEVQEYERSTAAP